MVWYAINIIRNNKNNFTLLRTIRRDKPVTLKCKQAWQSLTRRARSPPNNAQVLIYSDVIFNKAAWAWFSKIYCWLILCMCVPERGWSLLVICVSGKMTDILGLKIQKIALLWVFPDRLKKKNQWLYLYCLFNVLMRCSKMRLKFVIIFI